MKKLLSGFMLGMGLQFSANVHATIDVSAVETLNTINVTEMTASEFEAQFIAKDAGGLTVLSGRFQSPEALMHYYTTLTKEDIARYTQCASLLAELTPAFSDFKKQLTILTGVPLEDVKAFGVVGAGNTAATASPHAVVLGLEMICDKQSAGDISLTFKNYLAHELVHVTQYRLTKRTDFRFNLLEMALLEGSADYVATLLLEETFVLDDKRAAFGEANKAALMNTFIKSMDTFNYAPWLYTSSPTLPSVGEMPLDMGYWVGFQLATDYVANGGELSQLLALDDAHVIFDRAFQQSSND
ncbi:MAG: DUF2268 domain-containing putative Zn-dependent protease [Pseudomonadota bacterium]